MPRLRVPELLDRATGLDPVELESSLREVWFVNRFLGGNPVIFFHLKRLLRGTSGTVQILDVATGIADIPLCLLKWGRRRGFDLSLVGVDVNPCMVDLARRRTARAPEIQIELADARALPFADAAFDIALCNLALHHLDDAGAVRLLQEMQRVSRLGWIVTDLERHQGAYWAARVLARLIWRSPLTRHDGPLSVLRSFTPAEADELVQASGVQAAVHRHFPFRLAVVSGD